MRERLKHGCNRRGQKTPEYRSWQMMLNRCRNPKSKSWKDYGGRGIKVCERWLKFENFLADMGGRVVGLSIERINNDSGYEPGNCKWATRAEQNRNRRKYGPSKKTHCPAGHPYSGDNLWIYKQSGSRSGICRVCKTCRLEARKRRYQITTWKR